VTFSPAPYRVVVTGIGIVSPLGIGLADFREALFARRVAVETIAAFDASGYPSRMAAEVRAFDPAAFVVGRQLRWTDRYAQFALAGARLACDDAGFVPKTGAEDVGIYIGSALGGAAFGDAQHDVFRTRGLGAVRPLLALSVFGGSSVSNVAMALGIRGPVSANANACAAGLSAVGDAYRAVARGDVRAALAGGVEAPLSPLVYGAFTVIDAMSRRNDDPAGASRPFDARRDGFVMGEGAGILVLEREDDARRRGARIYGAVVGFGATCDAHHMSAPRPDGSSVAAAMRAALAEARVGADEVELVDAHASATPLGDAAEAAAIASVLGERSARVPVLATKGQHGHALGATGVWEIAVALLAMRERRLPATVNCDTPSADAPPGLVRAETAAHPRLALTNSSGFGGINGALVLAATDD